MTNGSDGKYFIIIGPRRSYTSLAGLPQIVGLAPVIVNNAILIGLQLRQINHVPHSPNLMEMCDIRKIKLGKTIAKISSKSTKENKEGSGGRPTIALPSVLPFQALMPGPGSRRHKIKCIITNIHSLFLHGELFVINNSSQESNVICWLSMHILATVFCLCSNE